MAAEFRYPPIKALCDRGPGEKEAAQHNDKRTHEVLRGFCRAASNLECADCTAKNPGWATLPHGAFICIDCAQIHRHIGRHISQVKAINTGTYLWYPDEVEAMRHMGNDRVTSLYCSPRRGAPQKPTQADSRPVKERYIRDKYEHKRWFDPQAFSSPVSTSTSVATPLPVLTTGTMVSSPSPSPSPTPSPAIPDLLFSAPAPSQPLPADDFFSGFGVPSDPAPAPAPSTDFQRQKADILSLFSAPHPSSAPSSAYPQHQATWGW